MNYEAELDNLLIQLLMEMYGIKNEEIAYKIFLIRFLIENYDKHKKPKINHLELEAGLPTFLISELNLPINNGTIYYKDQKILTYPTTKNSLANILDNWYFKYADTFTKNKRGDAVLKSSLINDEIKSIFVQAEKNIRLKKRDIRYLVHFKKNCLDIVKKKYEISPRPVGRISGFSYPLDHNDFMPTLDEKYERLVHADTLHENTNELTEDMLEKYLIRNLDLIEKGMQLISNQYVVGNGRLDILARDKDGTLCVIELKVEEDTNLIYQSIYYRLKIKEIFKVDNVRMITIAPYYPVHIKESLKALDDIEMYEFDIKLEGKKITDLKLTKTA